MQHVFTYGSLMFPEVWEKVITGTYESTKGTLYGYRRRSLNGESYPVVFEGTPTERVAGLVYLNVSDEDIARLDIFEGVYYERNSVEIALHDGKKITAQVYVLKTDFYEKVDDRPWDVEQFKLVGLARFLDSYQGFEHVSS